VSELIKSYDGDYLQSGIYPGLPHSQAPLWVDGANVLFTERSAQPTPAQLILIPKPILQPVRGIVEATIDEVAHVFTGFTTELWKWERAGGSVKLDDGHDALHWTGFWWGDWVVMAPWPQGVVQIWKTGTSSADLGGRGGLFSTARAVSTLNDHAIFLGLDTDPTAIAWSDQDNVEEYVAALTNAAGMLPVREAEGPLSAGIKYSGAIFFTTQISLFRLNYLGPGNYFGYKGVARNFGAFSAGCLSVGSDGLLYGFGLQGIWQTDGTAPRFISSPAIHDKVYQRINTKLDPDGVSYAERSHIYNDAQTKRMIFYYPVGDATECNESVAWNYGEKNWDPGTLLRTASTESGIFSSPLLGDVQGNVWVQTQDNTPISQADPSIELNEFGAVTAGYGDMGYGEGGYGGYDVALMT
jgi:hypothetical protein